MRLTRFLICILLVSAAGARTAAAGEWERRPTYILGGGGYDSNVNRVSRDAPPPGVEPQGDGRAVLYGGTGVLYEVPRELSLSLDVRPYYVKYFEKTPFDRLEIGGIGDLKWTTSSRTRIGAANLSRYIGYPNRGGFDRIYNSFRPRFVVRLTRRASLSIQYRNLYRRRPRSNLETTTANGGALWLQVTPTDRLIVSLSGEIDDQKVTFVFPREVSGTRAWGDLSAQYFVGRNTIVQAKYMYQRDRMDFVFSQGPDLDKLGDASEDVTDGPFQSIRFLEDTDFNFWKSLFIASSQTAFGENSFLNLFALYQVKKLEERVLTLADRPRREEDTLVLRLLYQRGFAPRWSGVVHLRFETNVSNDARREYRFGIAGVGVKRTF